MDDPVLNNETCGYCKYLCRRDFGWLSLSKAVGECRYGPPCVLGRHEDYTVFPRMKKDDFCYRFERRSN